MPDALFVSHEHKRWITNEYWKGADLVVEVVSGDDKDRRRDLIDKRRDYARARIPEYWIVDPLKATITVLRLAGKRYVVHGKFGKGQTASSHLLPGFTVSVSAAFSRRAGKKSKRSTERKLS